MPLASPCHKSYKAPRCSDGAGSWIHPYPSMPSIPFLSFFPISVSCILLFFSQKALILLWAGNAWDVCVTAKCHGNGGEGRLQLLGTYSSRGRAHQEHPCRPAQKQEVCSERALK